MNELCKMLIYLENPGQEEARVGKERLGAGTRNSTSSSTTYVGTIYIRSAACYLHEV